MSTPIRSALDARSDLVHRAYSHYGMQRAPNDVTRSPRETGPTTEQREQREVDDLVNMVAYALRATAARRVVTVKCTSENVRQQLRSRLTPEQLAGVRLC